MAYDPNRIRARLKQAMEDFIAELGSLMKTDMLEAFDSESGYNTSGKKVSWPELSDEYVDRAPPRGRGGSGHPILFVEGDLRDSIDVITKGYTINIGVFGNKSKPRWKGDSISIKAVSSFLDGVRPHTNPSKKFHPGSSIVKKLRYKHLSIAVNEMIDDGYF